MDRRPPFLHEGSQPGDYLNGYCPCLPPRSTSVNASVIRETTGQKTKNIWDEVLFPVGQLAESDHLWLLEKS